MTQLHCWGVANCDTLGNTLELHPKNRPKNLSFRFSDPVVPSPGTHPKKTVRAVSTENASFTRRHADYAPILGAKTEPLTG